MKNKVIRKLFSGFVQIHILHHAYEKPVYGSWMIEELREHGYDMSPGTLYPLLHRMEKYNLLSVEKKVVKGHLRKYYQTTDIGHEVLLEAKNKAFELFHEISNQKGEVK